MSVARAEILVCDKCGSPEGPFTGREGGIERLSLRVGLLVPPYFPSPHKAI